MSSPGEPNDPSSGILLQDPHGDAGRAEHHPHDQASEVAHAWEHFRENNWYFLGGFLPIILLTVIAFCVNFGNTPLGFTFLGLHVNLGTGNLVAYAVLGVLRTLFIAFFLQHLFKEFSFVFRTSIFTIVFLAGMIFLSLWDSEVRGIGNPIYDTQHPESMDINK